MANNATTTNPPDDWVLTTGAWKTDVDMADASDMPGTMADPLSGDKCVLFEDTTPASDPVYELASAKYVPVEQGMPYRCVAVVQGDRAAAGYTVEATVRWYTGAKVYISSNDIYASAQLPLANTWLTFSEIFEAPSTARYASLRLSKSNNAIHVALDTFGIAAMPIAFSAYLDADTALATGATIVCDAEEYDYGSNYATGTGIFTVPMNGIYAFTATGATSSVAGLTDQEKVRLVLNLNNGSYYRLGQELQVSSAAATATYVSATWVLKLSRGDTARLQQVQNSGGNITWVGDAGGTPYCTFAGFKVE